MDEVNPLGKRDQDVADPTTEVQDPILRSDVGRVQDAPVGGVDDPEPAPGKDISHADPSQATAKPLAVGLPDRGLVDVPGLIAHWPTLPAAPPQRQPPRSPTICPPSTPIDGRENSDRPPGRSPGR